MATAAAVAESSAALLPAAAGATIEPPASPIGCEDDAAVGEALPVTPATASTADAPPAAASATGVEGGEPVASDDDRSIASKRSASLEDVSHKLGAPQGASEAAKEEQMKKEGAADAGAPEETPAKARRPTPPTPDEVAAADAAGPLAQAACTPPSDDGKEAALPQGPAAPAVASPSPVAECVCDEHRANALLSKDAPPAASATTAVAEQAAASGPSNTAGPGAADQPSTASQERSLPGVGAMTVPGQSAASTDTELTPSSSPSPAADTPCCEPSPSPFSTASASGPGPWHHWLETELPRLYPKADQAVRVFAGIWNLHGKQAPSDLNAWLATKPMHHIYVVGTCECERSIEKSMLFSSKARWEQQVAHHLGEDYTMAGSHNMSAIHVMVFIHRYLWRYCWNIKTGQVATGFANMVGNKGGTQVGFSLGYTSVLFMNAHLAAHTGAMKERTASLSRILTDSPLRRQKTSFGVHEEYDRVFFMGDLNARVDASRSDVDTWLDRDDLAECLQHDQLLPLLRSQPAATGSEKSTCGLWPCFEEQEIRFRPTYKFDSGTDCYDSSKKKRVPSWTDRILWKKDAYMRPLMYGSISELRHSDHKPVFAQFEMKVDLNNWQGPEASQRQRGDSRVCTVQ
eukprot:TRINITY_DN10147_c0_g1_i1.p1 TRINITY_DN10147_c0_g1~~TRINITY_DN10147_c0_g1_i1.p1  ORF type:complete len:632 (+),score=138.79 TRINITY_DN10147_c0_g1_i1:213-2108(+)